MTRLLAWFGLDRTGGGPGLAPGARRLEDGLLGGSSRTNRWQDSTFDGCHGRRSQTVLRLGS
jgi:hypothetical protein